MGVVYQVEGRTSEKPFILKTYQNAGENALLVARFKQESEVWIRLGKHPNLVQCLWAKEFGDQLFVAAEYVWPNSDGLNTLTQHLATHKPTLQQQVTWICQFCYAMRYALGRGLRAHRDIKPDNLMIDGAGRLKVTDFGLAKALNEDDAGISTATIPVGNGTLTRAGTTCGTPPYMAPEQFVDSSAVDSRADIYSLGVVLYLLLSGGSYPIHPDQRDAGNAHAWAFAHMRQAIKWVDHPLMALCAKCLEKDRARRIQSYDRILEELSAISKKHRVALPDEERMPGAEMEGGFTMATSLRESGDKKGALAMLEKMLVRWPREAKLHTELGITLLELERLEAAHKATELALAIDSSRTAAWNNLGLILARLDRPEEAKAAFGKALLIEPENTGAMFQWAQLCMLDGDLLTAKKLCGLALFWRPEKVNVLRIASVCYLQAKETDRAEPLLKKLVGLEPNDTRAWFNLSLCYQSKSMHAEQIGALMEVLKRKPLDGEALNFLIQARTDCLQIDEAIVACRRLQQASGWEIVGACKEAQLLAHQEKPIMAHSLLTKWLKQYERDPSLWLTTAIVLGPISTYRQQALVAAQNAMLCHRENPKKLTPNNVRVLHDLLRELT